MHATKPTVMPSRKDEVAFLKDEHLIQLRDAEVEIQKRSQARIRHLLSASARGLKYMEETSIIAKQTSATQRRAAFPVPPDILFLPKQARDRSISFPSLARPVELRRPL